MYESKKEKDIYKAMVKMQGILIIGREKVFYHYLSCLLLLKVFTHTKIIADYIPLHFLGELYLNAHQNSSDSITKPQLSHF